MFGDIPRNVWWHCPEYKIPPIPRGPRIPFPAPVFLFLYIAQILIIFIDILSQPRASDEFNVFIVSSISSLVTWNEVILAFALYKKGGKTLALCIGVHIDEKNLLKRFAFSQKFAQQIFHQPIVVVLLQFFDYSVNDSE